MDQEGGTEGSGLWREYRLFGVRLRTNFPFRSNLLETAGLHSPDLIFEYKTRPPVILEQAPVHTSSRFTEDGRSVFYLFRSATWDLIRFTDIVDFYVSDGAIRCVPSGPLSPAHLEIYFLGIVLAYWLERRGIIALHASAVVVDGRAVAFVAEHGGGKSTLAATFMAAGHPLLSDDVLALDPGHPVRVRPSYPQMRMWPDQIARYGADGVRTAPVLPGATKRLVPVGPRGYGSFRDETTPLAAVYILGRKEGRGRPSISPVPPAEGLMSLIKNSFIPVLVQRAGLQPARLDILGPLVQQIPVRRISGRWTQNDLASLRRLILDELEDGPGLSAC